MNHVQPEPQLPAFEIVQVESKARSPRATAALLVRPTEPVVSASTGSSSSSTKYVVVGLVGLLGGAAFAVASMQGTSQPVLQQLSIHDVPSLVSGQDVGSLLAEKSDLVLYRSTRVRANETAEVLLGRLGISDPEAAAFLRRNQVAQKNLWGRQTRFVTVEANADQELVRLTARWVVDSDGDTFQRLVISRDEKGNLKAEMGKGQLEKNTRIVAATIQTSLFAATDAANLPDPVAVQLAEMFSTDVNFHKDLRKGDRFTVVYETLEADGEPLRSGRILSAEFINKGKAHQAVWFQETENSKGAYYALDGSNLRRAFLASPLEFSRVSSNFGSRFHPIRKTWRNHNGIDYAARTGTPVRTVGDGVVQRSEYSSSYGNVVYIDHGEGQVTVYAHLDRRDVKNGDKVEQGQLIGTVGNTGMSTGPHLHFEFRVNGEFKDPQIIAQESAAAAPITREIRERFDALAAQTRQKFEYAPLMTQASAE